MTKFKVGDVVVVKENTTAGHPKGTIGRVVKLEERDGTGQKACEVKAIHGEEHNWTMYHYYSDLRKVKGWDE